MAARCARGLPPQAACVIVVGNVSTRAASIQQITEASASLLDCVAEDVFDYAVNPDLLREYLANPGNALFVAMVAGQVIGMASGIMYVHPDKPRSLFINEVGVSGQCQRSGIGTQLVAAILDWGRRQGCVEAWVATEAGNTAARALYQTTGGVEDDERAVVFVYPLQKGRGHGSVHD